MSRGETGGSGLRMRSILDMLRKRKGSSGLDYSWVGSQAPLSYERLATLHQLEARLGYSFRNPTLLDAALTHRSFAYEQQPDQGQCPPGVDYEALEFLGDSVLGLIISDYLFSSFPQEAEGELSKMKSYLVSTAHLARLSQGLGLGDFLRLSHGEEKTGGRSKKAILADLVESLAAAIYLDGGFEEARRFLLNQFDASLTRLGQKKLDFRDYKSRLQEKLHQLGFAEPRYRVVDESGPPHKREFRVEVLVGGESLASGEGRSKKEAQQTAARQALEHLDRVPEGPGA